jgi:hypothetical protein
MPADQALGQAQLAAERPDFVLEQLDIIKLPNVADNGGSAPSARLSYEPTLA